MPLKSKDLYSKKRYWYHVSTTLKKKTVHLVPWDDIKGFNRASHEPEGNRICVAPTIEQCITAIPYYLHTKIVIYRTKDEVIAKRPRRVFDSKVTNEGWLVEPTTFVRIGTLNFAHVEKGLKIDSVIENSADKDQEVENCWKVLRWWRKAKIDRFIKKT
jgi:hypothetical protein